jgi:hypothetical protein
MVNVGKEILPIKPKIKKHKWRLPILLIIVLLIISVPVNWFLVGINTTKSLAKVEKFVEEGEYESAREEIKFRLNKIKRVSESIDNLGVNNYLIGRRYQELLRVGEEGLTTGTNVVNLMEYSSKITNCVMGNGEDFLWDRDIKVMKDELVSLGGGVGVLRARMEGDWQWLPSIFKVKMDNLKDWIDNSKNIVEVLIETIDVLPDFLGVGNEKKDYLVLLQNEMELRATGGFIGSYGILSFQNGRLMGFDIKDVYEADGQLKGHGNLILWLQAKTFNGFLKNLWKGRLTV